MSKRKRRKNKKNRNHANKYSSAPQNNHNNQNRKKNKGRYKSAVLPVDDICSEVLDISSRFWTVKDND